MNRRAHEKNVRRWLKRCNMFGWYKNYYGYNYWTQAIDWLSGDYRYMVRLNKKPYCLFEDLKYIVDELLGNHRLFREIHQVPLIDTNCLITIAGDDIIYHKTAAIGPTEFMLKVLPYGKN